jgi:hypothetical protein
LKDKKLRRPYSSSMESCWHFPSKVTEV